MWFSPDISPSEVPATFQRFAAIIGTEPWIKRYRALRAEQERNPLMRQFIDDRHSLELSLGPLVVSLLESGTVTPEQLTDGHYGAVSFVTPLARIYERVSESGRRRIQGMLRDGLNSHRGLLPFRNEAETVTHLMLRGFDVALFDIETGGGFDFLARGHGAEFEVECKSVSGDFGRKIHRQHMLALSTRLKPVLQEALGQRSGGQIMRILLPSRLHADAGFLQKIVDTASQAITTQTPIAGPEPCAVQLETFDLARSPFAAADAAIPEEAMRAFLDEHTGISNVHMFVAVRPARAATVVVVESRERDSVVSSLMRELKEAAKGQFTTMRPGILVVQFLDLDADDLLELAAHDSVDPVNASALQIATNLFFRSPERAHIHTLVYRSHGVVQRTIRLEAGVLDQTLQEQGPTYSFKNPGHPLAADPAYSVFSPEGARRSPG